MRRPLISCLVVTYNQEQWVEEAVQSLLNQTWPSLEIVCSDDASSDGTWSILQRLAANYTGPHRLILRRNAQRRNVVGHLADAFPATTGEFVVVAAGDDVSLPDRVERLVSAWEESGRTAHAINSDLQTIDEHGVRGAIVAGCGGRSQYGLEAYEQESFAFFGASGAYSRAVFEAFGELDPFNIFEDQVLPFRAALLGKVVCVAEPLVLWRRLPHSNSMHFLERPARARLRREKMIYQQKQHASYLRQRLADIALYQRSTSEENALLERLKRSFQARIEVAETAARALQAKRPSYALLAAVPGGKLSLKQALKFIALYQAPGLSDLWFRIRNPGR